MIEEGWETIARSKKAGVEGLIPVPWRIKSSEIPPVRALRDISDYVRRYLSPHDLEITDKAAASILENVASGAWTALEVTRAFCHRAAIAHQFVSSDWNSEPSSSSIANKSPDQLPVRDFLRIGREICTRVR
jgi:hypothetical protein